MKLSNKKEKINHVKSDVNYFFFGEIQILNWNFKNVSNTIK